MSNNKFYFELKIKLLKFRIFPFTFIFLFPKFSIFYSFFIRIKVKHPNFKNKKLRELLKFNLISSYVHLVFRTHVQKKLQLLLISKVYSFYLFKK